jgi:CDP-diacylglycerol---serine O-phosphatidyltransferase
MKHRSLLYGVPTLFTSLNLFCGFLSVIQSASGNFTSAAWLIFLAGIFDAFDGRIARASGLSSPFGLQMDSLSDVVSAGLAPALLVYQFHLRSLDPIGLLLAFLPLLFAAFRLARFNLYTLHDGKRRDYIGLPAPMAGVALASTVLFYQVTEWTVLLRLLTILVPLVSILMTTTIKFSGFPRFTFRQRGANLFKLVFFFIVIFSSFFVPEHTCFIATMIYLISGPVGAVLAYFRNEDDEITIFLTDDKANSKE